MTSLYVKFLVKCVFAGFTVGVFAEIDLLTLPFVEDRDRTEGPPDVNIPRNGFGSGVDGECKGSKVVEDLGTPPIRNSR